MKTLTLRCFDGAVKTSSTTNSTWGLRFFSRAKEHKKILPQCPMADTRAGINCCQFGLCLPRPPTFRQQGWWMILHTQRGKLTKWPRMELFSYMTANMCNGTNKMCVYMYIYRYLYTDTYIYMKLHFLQIEAEYSLIRWVPLNQSSDGVTADPGSEAPCSRRIFKICLWCQNSAEGSEARPQLSLGSGSVWEVKNESRVRQQKNSHLTPTWDHCPQPGSKVQPASMHQRVAVKVFLFY